MSITLDYANCLSERVGADGETTINTVETTVTCRNLPEVTE